MLVHATSLRALEAGRDGLLATLSFGWEPDQFYRDWFGHPMDALDLLDLKGPAMPRMSPQTERAPLMLAHFRTVLRDPRYIERLKRHYAIFRATVAGDSPAATVATPVGEKRGLARRGGRGRRR